MAKKKTTKIFVEYAGLLVRQRDAKGALPFFVLSATAADLLSWAQIERTVEKKGAAQRMLSRAHVASIKAYVEASRENIIPTAVTLALAPDMFSVEEYEIEGVPALVDGVAFAKLTVVLNGSSKPGAVIDGQHRLFGLRDTPLPLLCSVILGADQVERALHFLIINNKAKRVPYDLVKAIFNEMDPRIQAEFKERLESVRLTLGSYNNALRAIGTKRDSPFRGLIDWDINRNVKRRIVKPAALEGGLRALVTQLKLGNELDLDDAVEIFSAMWTGIKEASGVAWAPEAPRFLTKAAFVAITEYIVDRLNYAFEDGEDIFDTSYVKEHSRRIFSEIPSEFWVVEWEPKGLDTAAGRGLIKEAMRAVRLAANRGEPEPLLAAAGFLKNENGS